MILPIRTDSPLRNTPWMNWAIILLNVGVFLLQRSHPEFQNQYALHPRDPSLLAYFTYALLHANWPHLIGNMLFLYIFGNNVNDKMGSFSLSLIHISEPTRLLSISYAVFCLKKKK